MRVVSRNITLEASAETTQHPGDHEPHLSVMKDLRSHFSKSGVMANIGIVDTLRRWFPDHTVTQTPKWTGILKLAKAGHACATLDTNTDFYASRTYKTSTDHATGAGRLKYKVEFGRYNYRWNDRDFHVYVADYWESESCRVQNHYILYPRSEGDVIDGQSQLVDKLITTASQHLSEVDEEVWLYDRGYWRKNGNFWESVQACDWENVILNSEMKDQLISDIEGFFDRKEDYESFAVPWKVSKYDVWLT
jgi:transitional endoplasmic reticulum ATPase